MPYVDPTDGTTQHSAYNSEWQQKQAFDLTIGIGIMFITNSYTYYLFQPVTYGFLHLSDDNLITEEQFVHIPTHENHATEYPAGIGHCFIL
jgi:hypothetical protein